MSLADLPTMAEVHAARRGRPLTKGATRLATKTVAVASDAAQLRRWAQTVKRRDRGRCRVCHVRTIVTLALHPKRGEAHHIVSRTVKAVRVDPRNGLWVCLRCHSRFRGIGGRLQVVGTPAQVFVVNGVRYLNGDESLTFREVSGVVRRG
jgi:hypothetical protein